MSFSAHRPGRFGADGRFELPTPDDSEAQYLDEVRGPRPDGDAADATETAVIPDDAADTTEVPSDAAVPPADADTAGDPPTRRHAPRGRRRRMPARRLAILGGAEGVVLDDVPEETSRFVQMFFVLAGTALVSALSMLFALTTGVRISPWLAAPLALVWALIIFNLDRFLTSTMRSTRNVARLLGIAVPRVIMAALIGIVVAEPLVLQIFQNDIAREVTSTNVSQALSDQESVESGPERLALDAASDRVAALENQAATGVVAGTSSTSAESLAAQQTVDQLTAQLAEQQSVIDRARALYQCELTGAGAGTVEGCTGVTGDGASSAAAEAQLGQAQASYDDLAAQLQTATAALTAANAAGTTAAATSAEQNKQQARDALPAARAQYDAASAAYNERASAVAGSNAEAQGILSQISALERLSREEPVLAWAHWLIAGLFFMIELLPVLVKVLTSYGGPSLYEKADALRRQVALDRVTARTWRERASIVTTEASA
ncbi:DUF4407 domain-containing protein [Microbacterium sp. NPDC089189]|uniref:DUF4407 domain-containing protein n=1 Tax=Microbacterium sp. NPDC089189 TaxID=3154972 RepID=UPI00344910CE